MIITVAMLRISEKAQLQKNLSLAYIVINATADTFEEVEKSEKNFRLSKDFKEERYLVFRFFILKFNWISKIFSILSNDRFKNYLRINRISLKHIADLIRDDFVFHNQFNVSQASVKDQLHYAFYKFEHDDNANEFHFFLIFEEFRKIIYLIASNELLRFYVVCKINVSNDRTSMSKKTKV